MIGAIVKRDCLLALRSGGAWLHSVLFFILFTAMCAIALGGNLSVLAPLAPALIWLAVTLAMLLSFDRIFQGDAEDGSLEQMKLSGASMTSIVIGKLAAHWSLIVLPLLIAAPVSALAMGVSETQLPALLVSLLIGSPALVVYGAFAGACMVSNRQAGLIIILLTVPLLIPTLIFGLQAVDSYAQDGMFNPAFQALAGISLIALGLGIPATSAALKAQLE